MSDRNDKQAAAKGKTGKQGDAQRNDQSTPETYDLAARDTTGKGTPNAATEQVTTGTSSGRFQAAGEGAAGPHRGSNFNMAGTEAILSGRGINENTADYVEGLEAEHGAGQGIEVPQGMVRGESVEGAQDTLTGAGYMGGTDVPMEPEET